MGSVHPISQLRREAPWTVETRRRSDPGKASRNTGERKENEQPASWTFSSRTRSPSSPARARASASPSPMHSPVKAHTSSPAAGASLPNSKSSMRSTASPPSRSTCPQQTDRTHSSSTRWTSTSSLLDRSRWLCRCHGGPGRHHRAGSHRCLRAAEHGHLHRAGHRSPRSRRSGPFPRLPARRQHHKSRGRLHPFGADVRERSAAFRTRSGGGWTRQTGCETIAACGASRTRPMPPLCALRRPHGTT